MRKVKTLDEKIEEMEKDGWVYDDDFRVDTHIQGTMAQLRVIRKDFENDNELVTLYRTINANGKFGRVKRIVIEIH